MLKNKKILLGILAILLLFILPNMVNAQTTNAQEKTETSTNVEVEWSYELDGSENATNLKCTNISSVTGNLTIPSEIDNHKVTTLGYRAFYECTGLTAITIPETVTSFGEAAFYGCSGLTNVTLSENITAIEKYAFQNCTGLKNIDIPNNVTNIKDSAFKNCAGLSKITLSNTLTKLENECFANCTALTEIELPDTLTTIGTGNYNWYSPFDGCTALKYIKIPNTVVSMGTDLFTDCKNLTIFAEEGSEAETYAKNNKINFEKIENWEKRTEIVGSDVTAPKVTKYYIDNGNISSYLDKTKNDYRVPAGTEIKIFIEFSEVITGTDIPKLKIKIGTGNPITLSGVLTGGNKILYTYKITSTDNGLIASVSLVGGNLKDADGNSAILSVGELKTTWAISEKYVYADGTKQASTQEASSDNKTPSTGGTTETKDPTTATSKMPYTGRVVLAWIIGIVSISAVVAYIRYKKLYIK